MFSGGKPPDLQVSLGEGDAFVCDMCFSIDGLHLRNIWFIPFEEVKELRFIAFELTFLTPQLRYSDMLLPCKFGR